MDEEIKIKRLIGERLGFNVEEIDLSDKLIEKLGADSLDIAEITMDMEEEFGIVIYDEDAEKLSTVQDIVDIVKLKTNTH